jgi:hypothetical protein
MPSSSSAALSLKAAIAGLARVYPAPEPLDDPLAILGDVAKTLRALPLSKARGLLKKFPSVGDPGADREPCPLDRACAHRPVTTAM